MTSTHRSWRYTLAPQGHPPRMVLLHESLVNAALPGWAPPPPRPPTGAFGGCPHCRRGMGGVLFVGESRGEHWVGRDPKADLYRSFRRGGGGTGARDGPLRAVGRGHTVASALGARPPGSGGVAPRRSQGRGFMPGQKARPLESCSLHCAHLLHNLLLAYPDPSIPPKTAALACRPPIPAGWLSWKWVSASQALLIPCALLHRRRVPNHAAAHRSTGGRSERRVAPPVALENECPEHQRVAAKPNSRLRQKASVYSTGRIM